jgi:hypothetical protein
MEYITPHNVTKGSISGNGVFYAVCADSDVVQQKKNCWKWYSLRVRAEAVPGGSKQLNQSQSLEKSKVLSLPIVAVSLPWWRCGRRGSPHCCKPFRSNAEPSCEIVDRQRGQKPRKTKTEEPMAWGMLPGGNRWRHSRMRRRSVCCSEFDSVWISDSAVVTICKSPVNPIPNPNPVSSHSSTWRCNDTRRSRFIYPTLWSHILHKMRKVCREVRKQILN